MNFQVGELTEHFIASVASVLQLVVLLTERVGQRLVASVVQQTAGVRVLLLTGGAEEGGEGGGGSVQHLLQVARLLAGAPHQGQRHLAGQQALQVGVLARGRLGD